MAKIHSLKTWPEFYAEVVSGRKTFEVRKDDRGFEVGDCLVLQEFNPETQQYTLEMKAFTVTYILRDSRFLPDGVVVMAITPYPAEDSRDAA
jgi:uncharacterized protein YqfB (UPF0267 family)